MKKQRDVLVPGALDLTEQAVHLLRRKGGLALSEYYIGALPFVLGLLYFWSDMSRNANADWYLVPAAGAMALIFVWMKFWQVRYCRRLWCILNNVTDETWPLGRWVSVASRQALLHATGVVVIPIALLIMLPIGWVYAYYQNLSAMEPPDARSIKGVYKDAVGQAALWPAQNHTLLLILSVFGIFVIANIAFGLIMLPYLLNRLLGIETAFTLGGVYAMTNTTFLATISALTYLCIDPIIKAVYTLRCFYGSSRRTGDDLRAAFKPFITVGAIGLLLFAVAGWASVARSDTGVSEEPRIVLSSEGYMADSLDDAIERTLQQRRFAWRLPREKDLDLEDEPPGWLRSMLLWIKEKVESVFNAIDQWIEAFVKWLRKLFPESDVREVERRDWRPAIKLVFYLIGAGLVLILLLQIRRWLRLRRALHKQALSPSMEPQVDINDENISADDLPRDRWLAMARELMTKNDLRQALRAYYLALLAQLGDNGKVIIARHKSNRDYLAELNRHAHAEPALPELFSRCMAAFERSWYGMHPVAKEQLEKFVDDQERIDTIVQQAA